MLVMTTLFIGTSSSLPSTSYTKMIDIWMVFGLIFPFCEVILHVAIEAHRVDEDEEVNKKVKITKVTEVVN